MAEPILADSRLKGYGRRLTHPTMPLERCYCSICGTFKGWASMDSYEFTKLVEIVVVCDECVARHGAPPLVECKTIEEVR